MCRNVHCVGFVALSFCLPLLCTTPAPAVAEPIGWIERYALAEDRQAALAELVPGTEEYFYFHCLHHQVTGQLEAAEAMLSRWKQAVSPRTTSKLMEMETRQRLLTYAESPERTIEYLQMRLNVHLDHPPPVRAGESRYPSRLDQDVLQADRYVEPSRLRNGLLKRDGLIRIADQLRRQDYANTQQVRMLLEQLDGPWLDDLTAMVIAELKSRPSNQRALDLPIHQQLTLDQLHRVADEVPELAASSEMVAEVLRRLRPSGDQDMHGQPEVLADYLRRVDAYVGQLPPAWNSLKASVLYQMLQSDLAAGRPSRQKLLRYLRLPRQGNIVPLPRQGIVASDRRDQPAADLSKDYRSLAVLPPIGDERPLVRAYLDHFLAEDESTADFDGLLHSDYLRRVFAEAKLLAGVGPPDRWYEMLSPEHAQTLQRRVELTLAPTNPLYHQVDAATTLAVDVKNIPALVVRIYELNTHSYYRDQRRPPDTDIDLDAMEPTHQRRIELSDDAVRRRRMQLELDEISGRGVWVVDLVGGTMRARALIRRGELQPIVLPAADGLRVLVVDEDRRSVPGARLLITGHQLEADEHGVIAVPAMDAATARGAILVDDDLATAVELEQPAEAYTLDAAMLLDRQQVRSDAVADLLIRPRLSMNGHPVDPKLLQDLRVEVVATDRDEVSMTRRFDELQVGAGGDLVVSFRVPPRTARLSARLRGSVDAVATSRRVRVEAEQQWEIASLRKGRATHDAHLTRDSDRWMIEVRGLSGEPIAGAVVPITLQSRWSTEQIRVSLQSDAEGRIDLGPLEDAESISLVVGGVTRDHDLQLDAMPWPEQLHAAADQLLRLPLDGDVAAAGDRFRLHAIRSARPAEDHSDALRIDAGMLVVDGLAAGDYLLRDIASDRQTRISAADGPVVDGVAVGRIRHLQLPPMDAPGIASIGRDDEQWTVEVSAAGPLTRVHVIAGRYLTDADPKEALALEPLAARSGRSERQPAGYLSDLKLGDEYRYVMDRRYATKYPGVMLPTPGLILNPWETETTDNQRQQAEDGEAMQRSAPAPAAESESPEGARRRSRSRRGGQSLLPDYDFLSDSGVLIANLKVDEDGRVTIPAELLDGLQIIQVVACDPLHVTQRTVFAPLDEAPLRDLRLASALPAEQGYSLVRGLVGVSSDFPLDDSSPDAVRRQIYASAGDLLELFITICPDKRLAEFRPLGRWHQLDECAKGELYGRLACHELHVFLSIHDPEFFASVVRPYLANKKEKQFIDHFLLGNDISQWTEPWWYGRLSAAEKVLLASRDEQIREVVRREFSETLAMRKADPQRQRRLIEAALGARALEEAELLSSGVAPDSDAADRLDKMLGGMGGMGMGGMGGGMVAGDAYAYSDEVAAEPADARGGPRRPRREAASALSEAQQAAELGDQKPRAAFMDRSGVPVLMFQRLDTTKQWAESHWDRLRGQQAGGDTIPIDHFWLDLVNAQDQAAPPSSHLLGPNVNRHAALMAVALCGLPIDGQQPEWPEGDEPFAPQHPVVVVAKRLLSLDPDTAEPEEAVAPIMVGQRFEAAGTSDDESSPAAAPEEYLTGTPYRGQIILTNPSPRPQQVELFWQIPAGAMPLGGGLASDSRAVTIKPFAVELISYEFYFPLPGDFVHYPACVASDGRVVGRGEPRSFQVVEVPSTIDEASWEAIAQSGSAEQIAEFLSQANLRRIDWSAVLHRLRDADVYRAVADVLANQRLLVPEPLGYALHHRDQAGLRMLLAAHGDLAASIGPVLHSDLIVVDPIAQGFYEQLEYAPLVVARAHRLGGEGEIFNPALLAQYRRLLGVIASRAKATPTESLALVHYLLAQNRIEQAIERFCQIDRDQLETQLQYDYAAAYLAMHRGDVAEAEQLAEEYRQHPVPRWRQRFGELAEQLEQRRLLWDGPRLASPQDDAGEAAAGEETLRPDEADLADIDRQRRAEQQAAAEPSLELAVEGRTIQITHHSAARAVLNLYAVDAELLFSKTPLLGGDLAAMTSVRPTRSQPLPLAGDGDTDHPPGGLTTLRPDRSVTHVRLDESLARQTLVVEVISGPARATTLYQGGNLSVYVSEGFGQLQVRDRDAGTPLDSVYVKVYARLADGSVHFHKDGYTDLRGRFDYHSLSAEQPQAVEELAILVIDGERGATIRKATPPVER